jgi:hypothetical protein
VSTNFFAVLAAHDGACSHCSKPTRFHIGKRHGIGDGKTAWTYQALRAQDSPTGDPISLVLDWRNVLESPDVRIEDEYGSPISFDEFLEFSKNHTGFLWEWFS